MKQILKKSALSIFMLAAVFFAFEIAVRLSGYKPALLYKPDANPRISYVHVPGYTDGKVLINSHGFRDREFPAVKPAGMRRVMILGDSLTIGSAVALEETFPKILERMILDKRPAACVEVINAGTAGYSTVQEVEFLKEYGLQFSPDLVIVSYCLNDAEPVGTLVGQRSGFFRKIKNAIKYNSRSIYWAFERYYTFSVGRRIKREADTKEGYDYLLSIYEKNFRGWSDAERAFKELGKLSRERGFKVLVAINPDLTKGKLGADYPYKEIHARVSRACAAAGLNVADLFPAMKNMAPAALRVSESDAHYSKAGHEAAAKALYSELVSRKLLW